MKHSSMASSSPIILLIIFSMGLLISFSEARQFLVGGGEYLWKVPLPSPDSLSEWATRSRFKIGDSIVFEYDNKIESVHAVDEEDYTKCNTKGQQHLVFNDGNTEVEFTEAGTYHFISGNPISCKMGLKFALLVVPKLLPRGDLVPPPPSPLLPLLPPLPPPPPSPLSPPLPSTSVVSPSPLPSSSGSQGGATILSPSPSPSLPLLPLPKSSGSQGGDGNVGFIIWLGVSLALMVFLI